jgi:polyol permease family
MKDITTTRLTVSDKIGIPRHLEWGFFGVLLFMIGTGIELAWLSPYLLERGLTIEQSALLFTVSGVIIAISSWLSGVLTESLNPKKTMLLGLVLYMLGTTGFVGYGLSNLNFNVMLLTYAIRGFGYPLFAYSFLVWITYRSEQQKLGRAVGWFWFVFTGGFNVLSTYYSIWSIKHLGYLNTLWSSLFWVLAGAFFALVLNKASFPKGGKTIKWEELLKGLTIVIDEPKVLAGGLVRIINTTAVFAFPIFLPTYMASHGLSTTEWLKIWGTIFTVNIIFNLIFGFVGDSLGWRKTVLWFGCVGCAITTLLFYYSPQFSGGNFWIVMLCGILWGAALSGFVPLSALVPSLVEKDKGAAVAILNLGAGLSVFVGPLIVGLCIAWAGNEGVIWILAGLYLISAFITKFITLPAPSNIDQGN